MSPLNNLHSRLKKSYLLACVLICLESTSGKEKGTHLTLLNLSRRMPLQVMLKMSILDTLINLSSVGLNSGLTGKKSRPATVTFRGDRFRPYRVIGH